MVPWSDRGAVIPLPEPVGVTVHWPTRY